MIERPTNTTTGEFEMEFLRESNAIENVSDDDALEDAVTAWEYLQSNPSFRLMLSKQSTDYC